MNLRLVLLIVPFVELCIVVFIEVFIELFMELFRVLFRLTAMAFFVLFLLQVNRVFKVPKLDSTK